MDITEDSDKDKIKSDTMNIGQSKNVNGDILYSTQSKKYIYVNEYNDKNHNFMMVRYEPLQSYKNQDNIDIMEDSRNYEGQNIIQTWDNQ